MQLNAVATLWEGQQGAVLAWCLQDEGIAG
jgi:hypothetical protein